MSVSRRGFLIAGQALVAAAALPLKFFGASGLEFGPSASADLLSATKATFEPLVNSTFAVRSGSVSAVWLTLLSVEDRNSATPVQPTPGAPGAPSPIANRVKTDTFALHFYGTGEALPQGTYELEHRVLGNFSLFIVPAGQSLYTAIISHILGSAPIAPPKQAPSKARGIVPGEREIL